MRFCAFFPAKMAEKHKLVQNCARICTKHIYAIPPTFSYTPFLCVPPSTENNSDHPHPPHLQKKCPQNMPYNGGPVWHRSPLRSRDLYRKYGVRTQRMAYKHPLLCHMNRLYWRWGGLQFVEVFQRRKKHRYDHRWIGFSD